VCIGLVVFEGARLHEILLGVLAFKKIPVLQVNLNGDVRRSGIGASVEGDTVVLGLLEEDVHGFRCCHLMHEVESIEQSLRCFRVRVHEYIDEPVIVETVRGR